jgi:hypothetical protein
MRQRDPTARQPLGAREDKEPRAYSAPDRGVSVAVPNSNPARKQSASASRSIRLTVQALRLAPLRDHPDAVHESNIIKPRCK